MSERQVKMSLNDGQVLAGGGQDLTRNASSSGPPWENAGKVLKPCVPSRKPKPVSTTAVSVLMQQRHLQVFSFISIRLKNARVVFFSTNFKGCWQQKCVIKLN